MSKKDAVSEGAEGFGGAEKSAKSSYNPFSRRRVKSMADLRQAAKVLSEKSDAGEYSPTGSEGGQDGKHGGGGLKKTGKKVGMPKAKKPVDLEGDEMTDELDEFEDGSEQTKEGMTPSGKPRSRNAHVKRTKKLADSMMD